MVDPEISISCETPTVQISDCAQQPAAVSRAGGNVVERPLASQFDDPADQALPVLLASLPLH
jgi:hypothetical protein